MAGGYPGVCRFNTDSKSPRSVSLGDLLCPRRVAFPVRRNVSRAICYRGTTQPAVLIPPTPPPSTPARTPPTAQAVERACPAVENRAVEQSGGPGGWVVESSSGG